MLFGTKGGHSIKDIDGKEGIVISYPSTFNIEDAGGDIVERGAFKRTIGAWGPNGKNRIKALYQHDPSWMVGRPIRLEEDSFGLLAETKFSDTSIGRDTFTLIKDGVITEESIGYDVILAEGDGEMKRHLRELRLYEYSFVTWGMNEATPILGVKGNHPTKQEIQTRMERFEKALKDGDFASEEVPHAMQIAIAQWKDALELIVNGESVIVHDLDSWLEWFVSDGEKAERLLTEIKEGRVLSTSNRSLIENALEALQALLDAADSSKGTQSNQDPPGSPDNSDLLVKGLREVASMAKARSIEQQLRDFAHSLRKE